MQPQAPEDKRSSVSFKKVQHDLSVFLGIWTSLGCNRWWWWSSIVTKRWGEALQYAIRSSAWSGPARFGNWDQVNEMMVRCMSWQLNYYLKTQNYMVWRSVNLGVCSLQFLFWCFREREVECYHELRSAVGSTHIPRYPTWPTLQSLLHTAIPAGSFSENQKPNEEISRILIPKIVNTYYTGYNLVMHNSWFIVRAFHFRLCAPRW